MCVSQKGVVCGSTYMQCTAHFIFYIVCARVCMSICVYLSVCASVCNICVFMDRLASFTAVCQSLVHTVCRFLMNALHRSLMQCILYTYVLDMKLYV